MGFLGNLDKVNTLELFLTDKGKELMLKENGLGLEDLITRFSLDDADYDYRRTSNVWVDGISPVPDGSLLPFGTVQNSSNNSGGPQWFDALSSNNPCRSCDGPNCAPLSGACWYDMPDVRGDRGKKIINCYPVTAQTQGVKSCTNIYAFYDVTSVLRSDADAAKNGLESWYTTISATTPNFTGKLFHIAVFGERWVNTSWYPWNGKLDTWDWTPCGNHVAGSPLGYPCNNNSSTFLGGVTGPVDETGRAIYGQPVTGLYLQADDDIDTGITTGNWTGFNVLPPNASVTTYGNGTGSRAEFWTTGCTMVDKGAPGYDYDRKPLSTVNTVGFTAYTADNIVWDSNAFAGTTWSAYTPNDLWISPPPGLGFIPPEGSSSSSSGALVLNLCEDNCCPSNYPDLDYRGPGLFGCQECNPFDNTITHGTKLIFENKTTTYSFKNPDLFSAGTMDLMRFESIVDCVKYRGMDRNVLIVDVFDETQGGQDQNNGSARAGGILPLGLKSYYNGTDGNASNLSTSILGDSNGETSPTWGAYDFTGYHGGGNDAAAEPTCIPSLTNNWGINASGQIAAIQQQPTEDWKYSQDLFLKTHGLYENFQGFIYPVVPLKSPLGQTSTAKMVFPLHLYGALYGEIVPISEFRDNPTVVAEGGTLSACTITNDYDVLIPVTYDPNGVTQMNQNTNSDWEPFDSSQFDFTDAISPYTPYVKGMKNWGWAFNPTVGCSGFPCNVGDIFSGGTFENDLNSFITGSSYFVTTITSACTECQCLPAVFINKRGPIEVIDDGCPCPDGTVSPKCCETEPGGPGPENPITAGICGPIPNIPINGGATPSDTIGQSGEGEGKSPVNDDLYIPKSYTNFRSGLGDSETGIGSNIPALRTTSNVNNYSSMYSIDFNITLQQFYVKDKLNWDVEFVSTSRYGDYLIQEGDGSIFYWMVGPGYKKSKKNPKETKACISPTIATINLNKNKSVGVNVAYLKGYWTDNEDFRSETTNKVEDTIEPIVTYEFCITMVYSYKGKLLKKTKRFSVAGNDYGYKLIVKS